MSELLGPLFSHPALAVDDRALLDAMLAFERALASVQGAEFPDVSVDIAALGREAVAAGNPVVPLVRLLRAEAPWVHQGATSQDVLDTALSLVAKRAVGVLLDDLRGVAASCARLAGEHRDTVMAGRTLLQQAVPITFGLKCAGWLVAVDRVVDRLSGLEFAVQFGGAAGTLAAGGADLVEALAAELGLAAPLLPWHTDRTRIAELATALGTAAGVLAKIATDVLLLSQTEVGELAEGTGGGSSAMPHKQNPVRAVLVTACARRTPGLVATLLSAMPHEHERAAGAWHAEWQPLTELLTVTAGAAHHARQLLDSLRVFPDRMRRNLDLTRGALMAERVATRLSAALGPAAAQDVVTKAAKSGIPLGDALLADPDFPLSSAELDEVLDPAAYLGGAGAFVDRALAAHARKDTKP